MKRLLSIALILGCTSVGWFILATALSQRSHPTRDRLQREVESSWGVPLVQLPPQIYYVDSNVTEGALVEPVESRVEVSLKYDPKKKGLLWYRTYLADFRASYLVRNSTSVKQTIRVDFAFPAADIRYDRFSLSLGTNRTDRAPTEGRLSASAVVDPGVEVPLEITYWAAGLNRWDYSLGSSGRVRQFSLRMKTDFSEINIPDGAESPTSREAIGDGWQLAWDYSDVIGARSVGMDMPAVVNPGPVAARMTFFAPVSLIFYFAVLVILGMVRTVRLHPMHYFFLAAGCFVFQLLFAYLVDLIPTMLAFIIAAAVSLVLVTGYLWKVAGRALARVSALAQFAYMVLFSYSFFFSGLTGITVTIGAVITLALLMGVTAKVDWESVFLRA